MAAPERQTRVGGSVTSRFFPVAAVSGKFDSVVNAKQSYYLRQVAARMIWLYLTFLPVFFDHCFIQTALEQKSAEQSKPGLLTRNKYAIICGKLFNELTGDFQIK